MVNIEKLKPRGFENLFVISSACTLALFALIFTSAKWALFVLMFSFPIAIVIYKSHSNVIDSFFAEQRLSSKSANELAMAYLYAQGLVVGAIFGWTFGCAYFS